MPIQCVTVPYRYDEYLDGLGKGPDALLAADLKSRLERAGVELAEPVEARMPDEERLDGPISANIGMLGSHVARTVADARQHGDPVLVLAGDDTAAIGVVSGLQHAHGAETRIGLIWLDAHADFNTPETTVSGILAGMPVAILAGLAGPIWRASAQLLATIPTDRILIAGTREIDDNEGLLLRSTDVRVIPASEIPREGYIEAAIDRLAHHVDFIIVNIDTDILDPSLVPSSSTPSRHGLSIRQTARIVSHALSTGKTAIVSVTSLNPGAAARGERSIESTISLLESSLARWDTPTKESNHV